MITTNTLIAMWKAYRWTCLIWGIIIVSLLLRVYQIDRFPLDTNSDGLAYAWAGSQLLSDPLHPSSMSLFFDQNPSTFWYSHYDTYDTFRRWDFRLVDPFLDQPPWLLPVIGFFPRLLGYTAFEPVPEFLIRLPAVLASFLSIGLLYVLVTEIFNKHLAAVSILVYGVTPYFVFSHRESFIENFLIPLYLLGLLFLWRFITNNKNKNVYLFLAFVVCVMASSFKVVGAILPVFCVYWLLYEKKYRAAVIIGGSCLLGLFASIGVGFLINADAQKWILLKQSARGLYAGSLTDLFIKIEFYSPFNDGWYVLGFIAWCIWLFQAGKSKVETFFLTASVFILLSIVGTSGIHNNFPWYRYPLFPWLSVAVAKLFIDFWKVPQFGSWIIIALLCLSNIHLLSPLSPLLTDSLILRIIILILVGPYLLIEILSKKFNLDNYKQSMFRKLFIAVLLMSVVVNIAVVIKYPTLLCTETNHCKLPEKFVLH